MSKESKIFQPKIIIGSITSFIVAAVGVIAVFFPSLLNLEKKSMPEKVIFLRSQDSLEELYKFLEKNIGKPVKLSIGYCHLPSRTILMNKRYDEKPLRHIEEAYNNSYWDYVRSYNHYIEHFGDNPFINPEEEKADVTASGAFSFISGQDVEIEGFTIDKGTIHWNVKSEGGGGLYHGITIPHSSENGKKYVWSTNVYGGNALLSEEAYKKLSKAYDKQCPKEIEKWEGYEIHKERMATLGGIFFVHDRNMDDPDNTGLYIPYSENIAHYNIELEQLDKKELELRNY